MTPKEQKQFDEACRILARMIAADIIKKRMKSLYVSIETAKRLKAAGWIKHTEFVHDVFEDRIIHFEQELCAGSDYLFAPTAEEILRELPKDLEDKAMLVRYFPNVWRVSFGLGEGTLIDFGGYTLSEAAAQMWLWCKKEGYVK